MLNACLSHVALGVDDVDRSRRFYEDRLGLQHIETTSAGEERLGLGRGSHILEVTKGRGLEHFALEVAESEDLEALAEALTGEGLEGEWIDPNGAHPRSFAFLDPAGHRVELHGRIARSGEATADGARRPIRLHHVTLSAEDVPRLAGFYESVLGFVVSDRMGESFAWLRCNREHHTLAITQGPKGGLDHYCYEVADWNDLKVWSDGLAAGGVPLSWGPGRHGPGNNLFVMFDDPDTVRIELSCEMERFWDDRVRYPGARDWSAEPRTVNLWGPAPEWRTGVVKRA
jgi:catechol 2,3-dioxygenase-like lactoylglutathione lyase family enzyme